LQSGSRIFFLRRKTSHGWIQFNFTRLVQGYRPDGKGGFTLRDGVFHRFCEKVSLSPGRPHVFIIDEINRGNLAKILGELMLLIEHVVGVRYRCR